ncbi:MAG: alkaline phosphatase family protein [Candidatus Cyclonatronum sp.]|nr:alkaline phosphatase family protein [Cyclonatronum sp.]MCH8487406.1 alkaline phosphatase family protein [Cyclonatronum sp.]
MSIIFIFIDGIGLAPDHSDNPFSRFASKLKGWEALTGGRPLLAGETSFSSPLHLIKPVDANLETVGLPQSGTGQTALFTGLNASKVIGRHFGPYPHSQIRPLLETDSFFIKLGKAEKSAVFMNAYPPVFFERVEKTKRWSSSTFMVRAAGEKLRTTADVLANQAVTAELFGDYWREKLGISLPKRTGSDIADILLQQASERDMVFLEYYLTDKAGHARDADFAFDVLSRLDQVFIPLVEKLGEHTLVISSDHGNLEDLSRKTHTRNPVPLIVMGPLTSFFSEAVSIMDVTPCMVKALTEAKTQ